MKKEIELVRCLRNWKFFIVIIILLIFVCYGIYFWMGDNKQTYYFLEDNQCILVRENSDKITFSHYSNLADCENLIINQCQSEDDCVRVQTSCCSCNMGGEEKCVLKFEVGEYAEKLKDCSPMTLCSAVFLCEIKSCKCVNGVCVG